METKSCACNAFNEWECQVKYSAIIWQIKPAAVQTVRSASMTVSRLQIDSRRKRHEIPFCSDVMCDLIPSETRGLLFSSLLSMLELAQKPKSSTAYAKGQARPQIGTFNFGDRNLQEPFWSSLTWFSSSIFDVWIQPTHWFGAITLLAIFQQYYRWRHFDDKKTFVPGSRLLTFFFLSQFVKKPHDGIVQWIYHLELFKSNLCSCVLQWVNDPLVMQVKTLFAFHMQRVFTHW